MKWLAVYLFALPVWGQEYQVPLKIALGVLQGIRDAGGPLKSDDSGVLHATLPGGLNVRADRIPAVPGGVKLTIPDADPNVLILLPGQNSRPGQSSRVTIQRSLGQWKFAEYLISYVRSERDGKVNESLTWEPAYRAVGRLKLPGCEIGVMVLDFNGDGVFDSRDHTRATAIGFDLNNDGVIQGQAEYRMAAEIVDVCGLPLQIAALDPKGASITFRVSELRPAVVDSPVPEFSILSTDGQLIRSSDFRKKIHVLDFWASWCGPCVAKLVAMGDLTKKYGDRVKVIGINVDEPERLEKAEKILSEKHLPFLQVIRQQGEKDFLWKIFGSMDGAQLSIPLYVVIDDAGTIRFAGDSGNELERLYAVLEKLLSH